MTGPGKAMANHSCILVVDDDAPARAAIAGTLREAGYQVVCAANGWEALNRLPLNPPPRLILLDPPMPLQCRREFRAEQVLAPDGSTIPVVLMSGARDLAEQALALGVAGYLPKPFAGHE